MGEKKLNKTCRKIGNIFMYIFILFWLVAISSISIIGLTISIAFIIIYILIKIGGRNGKYNY